ncbi:MAG: DUF1015 domain-containing protein [Firmicutes bacterium]|nr:DUF1015 domain-containing protein [Bacillota bacterium]
MAVIKPFRALRPRSDLADKIAALPYDVMNSQEAKEMVKQNKYSFLHIDRAEINFPEPTDPHEPRVYLKAKEILDQMIAEDYFIQDETECLYIYRQIMDGRAQTGLVCCTAIDDYKNNIIKKHEYTRADKEEDRIAHIKAVNAHTGPIFQTYLDKPAVKQIINHWADTHQPIYQFSSSNVEHICWVIDCSETIEELVELFDKIQYLYIADGHHRSQAAFRVGMEMRQENSEYSITEEFNYFLSVLFPASDLKIMPYNRLVRDLAGLSKQEFFQQIQERFTMKTAPFSPYQPERKHVFGMYLDNQWYQLIPKPELIQTDDPVKSLDVAILQDQILAPILNIIDPRTDERIEFVGGIRGLRELENRVNTNMKAAFSLYPTSINQVINVADKDQVMPPKSTWFEPKLLSGIFIHKLS